jgi:DNA-3-methyladenine glycosylase II
VSSPDSSADTASNQFRLEARGDYSFAASVRFLEGFAPAGQGAASGKEIHWTFLADDLETVASVLLKDADSGVEVEVLAGDPKRVRDQLDRVLSLDIDGSGFPDVGGRDPIVARLQARYPGLRPVLFFSPFEAAVWALISQRIRICQAAAIKQRMADELGESVTIRGQKISVIPGPGPLHELDNFPSLAANKIRNLHALAEAAEDGFLEADRLRALPPERALDELKTLPGVGDFSAQLILLRGAGGPDHPPASEPRMRRAVALAYGGAEPSSEKLEALAENWKPYRTWVTFLLRMALESEATPDRQLAGIARPEATLYVSVKV